MFQYLRKKRKKKKKKVPCFIFRIEAWYEQELAQATEMMQYKVQFLLMELESVGNIRLEEGCSTDPWYLFGITICYYIMHSNLPLQRLN